MAPLSTDWSKAETDHLFDLCEQYSLRFIIVADRFDNELSSNAINTQKKRDVKSKDKENKKLAKVSNGK